MRLGVVTVFSAAFLFAAVWLAIRRPEPAPPEATPSPDEAIATRQVRKPRLPAPQLPRAQPTPGAPDVGARPTN